MIFDLTHPLKSTVPTWNNELGFQIETVLSYSECTTETKFRVQRLCMNSGIGTHIDAPAHCFSDGITVDNLPLTNLIGPCVVIDISDRAHETYTISVADIKQFEARYGSIPVDSFVIIATGWDTHWNDREKYHNNWQFPVLSVEAADLLVGRNIVGVGIDTLGPDLPTSGYPVHRILLGAGKYIVENVANARQLPAIGTKIIILPLRIVDGTESPVRIVAIGPESVKNF